MTNLIDNYLNNREYKMIINEDSIYIVNYKRLLSLEQNFISIIIPKKKILIYGKELVLKKIVDEELLIKGSINKIEVIDE